MKRLILALCAFLFMASAFAGATTTITQIDVSKLTAEQRASLLSAAAKMEAQPDANPGFSETMRKEVEKWGELGTGMGRAAVNAAKEVGVATNEFVQTPLGKVTMGVVLYKVMGHEILRFAVCMLLITIFLPLGIFFITKRHGDVEYEYVPVFRGMWNKRVVKKYEREDAQWVIETIIGVVCGIIVVASAINSF